jgi:hypothetical protein
MMGKCYNQIDIILILDSNIKANNIKNYLILRLDI